MGSLRDQGTALLSDMEMWPRTHSEPARHPLGSSGSTKMLLSLWWSAGVHGHSLLLNNSPRWESFIPQKQRPKHQKSHPSPLSLACPRGQIVWTVKSDVCTWTRTLREWHKKPSTDLKGYRTCSHSLCPCVCGAPGSVNTVRFYPQANPQHGYRTALGKLYTRLKSLTHSVTPPLSRAQMTSWAGLASPITRLVRRLRQDYELEDSLSYMVNCRTVLQGGTLPQNKQKQAFV